jgi:effector-binding domain-containing protein
MSKITELASCAITAADTLTIELVEADETPTVVIIRWPAKASVLHPGRFPDSAAALARLFAEAATALAQIKTRRRL